MDTLDEALDKNKLVSIPGSPPPPGESIAEDRQSAQKSKVLGRPGVRRFASLHRQGHSPESADEQSIGIAIAEAFRGEDFGEACHRRVDSRMTVRGRQADRIGGGLKEEAPIAAKLWGLSSVSTCRGNPTITGDLGRLQQHAVILASKHSARGHFVWPPSQSRLSSRQQPMTTKRGVTPRPGFPGLTSFSNDAHH